ncbi:MAG: ABC transporter ATP-binding protein [Acidimicrobiales bacterium]|jgi:iron(III) transport system ATP-binding protein
MRVCGLHKSFGPQAVLMGVDLEIPSGSFTAILGPSGSGKTTLLRVLAGLERADRGTVAIGSTVVDDDREHVPAERRRLGYVSQEGSLFPHLTVEANVGFGLPRGERRGGRVGELLETVGLSGLARRYPHELSGGQQQRVAVARALAVRPQAVLLDEPFASLDAQLRASVRSDVRDILLAAGTTAVLVTHDQDEALSIADFVAVIRNGRIAQFAEPAELYARPVDADLARFVGAANLLEGRQEGGVVETPLGPAAAGGASGPVTVLVRPEQLEIARLDPAGSDAGRVAGRVVSTSYHGHDCLVYVRPEGAAGDLTGAVVARTLGDPHLAEGSAVTLRINGPVLTWAPASGPAPAPAAEAAEEPA